MRLLCLTAALLLAMLAATVSAQAITNGHPDGNGHSNVGQPAIAPVSW